MISNNSFQVGHSGHSILISLQGHGPPVSFKNSKAIFRNCKNGKPFIATKPEYKTWMERVTRDLQSQLNFLFQTIEGATSTAVHQPCLTALLQHCTKFDDSRQWIPSLTVRARSAETDEIRITIELI